MTSNKPLEYSNFGASLRTYGVLECDSVSPLAAHQHAGEQYVLSSTNVCVGVCRKSRQDYKV